MAKKKYVCNAVFSPSTIKIKYWVHCCHYNAISPNAILNTILNCYYEATLARHTDNNDQSYNDQSYNDQSYNDQSYNDQSEIVNIFSFRFPAKVENILLFCLKRNKTKQ